MRPLSISNCREGLNHRLRREKRRTRKAWNAEWGRIGREGNLWWLGDVRAHWEQVFGPRTWTWLRMSLFFNRLPSSASL